jgi:hypothetical protein
MWPAIFAATRQQQSARFIGADIGTVAALSGGRSITIFPGPCVQEISAYHV